MKVIAGFSLKLPNFDIKMDIKPDEDKAHSIYIIFIFNTFIIPRFPAFDQADNA